MKRAKRRGMLRNVAAILAASDAPQAESTLRAAVFNHPDPCVHTHAESALPTISECGCRIEAEIDVTILVTVTDSSVSD